MRKIIHRFFKIVFIVGSILLFAEFVRACSCIVSPPVNIAFQQTPNVVILKVKSVEKYKDGEKGYGYDGIKQSKLTVEKVFKGNLKVGQELSFAQGSGADCIWAFTEESIGEDFLFYLGEKPIDNKSSEGVIAATGQFPVNAPNNVWIAFTCSRSGRIKYRADDLKYIENIEKLSGKTRLSGTISQRIESAIEGDEPAYKQLANRNVRIVGNGKDIQIKTDKNGVYEVYDLPVGKYQVSIEPIAGYKTTPFDYPTVETIPIQIKAKQHIEQEFEYYIDNSINGKLFDSNGKLLKDVCLELSPVDGKKSKYFFNFDCTNENGGFNLSQIPIGKYVIVVNYKNEISARQPFGLFYYPNKLKLEEAQVIKINAGEHIKNVVITAPTTAEIITISGKLVFENGVGTRKDDYEYVAVEFKPDKNEKKTTKIDGESRAVVDEKGNFSIRILKGQKGILYGTMTSFIAKYVNCPKLDKLVKAKGNSVEDIETPVIQINAEKDIKDVIFKFPFPNCKRAKID